MKYLLMFIYSLLTASSFQVSLFKVDNKSFFIPTLSSLSATPLTHQPSPAQPVMFMKTQLICWVLWCWRLSLDTVVSGHVSPLLCHPGHSPVKCRHSLRISSTDAHSFNFYSLQWSMMRRSFKKDSFKVLLTSELRELTWQQRIRVKLLESWMLVMRVEMSYSLFCLVNGRFNFTECQHFYTTLAELVWTDLHPTAPSTLLTNPAHFTLKQISLLSTNKKVLIKLWLLLRDEICWVQQHSDLSSHNWLLRRNVIKQIEQSFAVESGVKPVFEAVGAAADGEFL